MVTFSTGPSDLPGICTFAGPEGCESATEAVSAAAEGKGCCNVAAVEGDSGEMAATAAVLLARQGVATVALLS